MVIKLDESRTVVINEEQARIIADAPIYTPKHNLNYYFSPEHSNEENKALYKKILDKFK